MPVRAAALILLSTLSFFGQAAPKRIQADPSITCDSCDEWNQPREPFKVFGNTYYVGVTGLSAVLIASDAGLILVDGGLPQSVPLIDAGIRKLGFKTENIKLILNGHTHYDHAGGLNALQRFTGARVATGAAGVRALEQGKPTGDDPQVGFEGNGFPPVTNVHGVTDGEVLRVGDLAITAHATPGHTPGGTTWSWRSCEGTRCLDVVYADSISAVAAPRYRFTGDATHPSIVESFRRSITRMSQLPCDVMIGAHPSVGDMDGKLKRRTEQPGGPNPFIDPGACRALAAGAMKGLDERVADESRTKQNERSR
jgi:metallo-beta-lactamase class B